MGCPGTVQLVNVHATRKLLDRVKPNLTADEAAPSNLLGNWYATAIMWRPQTALFVNETTLLPVFVPLTPARTVLDRFGPQLHAVLTTMGAPQWVADQELDAITHAGWTKTANRSVVGSMTEFVHMAEHIRRLTGTDDLVALSVRLADTPCSPPYDRHISPDREVAALINTATQP